MKRFPRHLGGTAARPSVPTRSRLGDVALAAGLVFGGAGVVGLAAAPSAGASAQGQGQTVTWHGNGTDNGYCSNMDEGLSGVPAGEEGWLFILTSPTSGPWSLTASFSPGGTATASGTQMGNNGAVHFVVYSQRGAQLLAASATDGSQNSVLTVSGCTNGDQTTTTTTTTTTKPTTTTTTTVPTSTTVPSSTTTKPTSTTTPTVTVPSRPGGGSATTAGSSTSPTAGQALPGATAVHTGQPWSGSRPVELALVALGVGLIGLGVWQRRRVRSGASS